PEPPLPPALGRLAAPRPTPRRPPGGPPVHRRVATWLLLVLPLHGPLRGPPAPEPPEVPPDPPDPLEGLAPAEAVAYSAPVDAAVADPFRPPDHPYGPGNRGLE